MALKDITVGQYAPRASIIHSLDPRTKFGVICMAMVLVFSVGSGPVLVFIGLIGFLLFRMADLGMGLAVRNLRPFVWIFLLTGLLHAFYTQGSVIVTIPVVNGNITREGLRNGIFYCLRISVLLVYAGWFTLTTSPMEFTDALERLLRPFRRIGVPSHEIAIMMSIAIRFIPLFIDETERIKKAQISRGSRFDGGPIRRVHSALPVVVPLFLSAFRRANDLAYAMDSRCYQGGDHRTHFHELVLRRSDRLALAAAAAAGCLILALDGYRR
jgi:energy-coupling factor transport system permease protein